MQFSTPFALAALLFLISTAKPLEVRQDLPSTYTLTAIHSGDESVHNQPIVAAQEHFYIGRNSTALCNPNAPKACPATTAMELSDTRAALNVVVPGGQTVYIDTAYALSYTAPHENNIAGENDGFALDPNSNDTSVSVHNLVFNGDGNGAAASGWLACPFRFDGSTIYQVFANVTGVQVPGTSVSYCHDILIALQPGVPNEMPYEFS